MTTLTFVSVILSCVTSVLFYHADDDANWLWKLLEKNNPQYIVLNKIYTKKFLNFVIFILVNFQKSTK